MKIIIALALLATLVLQCTANNPQQQEAATEYRPPGEQPSAADPSNELVRLVRENLQAMEDENLDKAMQIMSKDMEGYAGNRLFTQQLFATYDLDYTLESIDVVELTATTAQVAFVYTIEKISGGEFFDQRNRVLLHFTTEDGEWKVIEREVATTYL